MDLVKIIRQNRLIYMNINELCEELKIFTGLSIDELKTELTSLRQQVREKEKANVESAERKLSLVSLLDKAVKAE